MHKHWIYFTRSFMLTFQFRTELIVYVFTTLLPIAIWLLAWKSILGDQTIHGFNFQNMVAYYLLSVVLRIFTRSEFENYRVQQIREGKIDYFLTKPIAYFFEVWWRKIGSDVGLWIWAVPLLVAGGWLAQTFFQFPFFSHSAGTWLLFGLFLVFNFLVEFGLSFFIVLLGFWFEGAEGLQHFKWFSITILSGNVIPFAFMPEVVQPLLYKLPFRYMYQLPIELMLGTDTVQLWDLVIMVGTLLGLAGISFITWKMAIHQYASSGG